MRIFAAVISASSCQKEKFHQQLRRSSFHHGLKERKDNTNMPGGIGWFGTVSGLKIPFRQLK
ncbi:hypothetical protein DPMN_111068 [Dreissena polymorpha]|uniref:Uncharacterized protein n=1 Tax=Dreissena polymorpha TaxID=45954 RepID=A0A9D4KD60_DREPO|nr:hypothetical protein DPMN_111068 [Dreissena polymorpha]